MIVISDAKRSTASAAALKNLRKTFPEVSFVGMEPAVKPAAKNTHSGVVGVLATPATFQGALYASVVERFASDITIIPNTCQGLVEQIEAGKLEDPLTEIILQKALIPMQEADADTIVLGCTHYPFIIPIIRQIVGEEIDVIDPSPAIARQTRRLLVKHDFLITEHNKNTSKYVSNQVEFLTTGIPEIFRSQIMQLLNVKPHIRKVHWEDNQLKYLDKNN
jgi:glutamate racemase